MRLHSKAIETNGTPIRHGSLGLISDTPGKLCITFSLSFLAAAQASSAKFLQFDIDLGG
jgi:hypothetical protein